MPNPIAANAFFPNGGALPSNVAGPWVALTEAVVVVSPTGLGIVGAGQESSTMTGATDNDVTGATTDEDDDDDVVGAEVDSASAEVSAVVADGDEDSGADDDEEDPGTGR